jgi:hypothetical protein
MTTPQILMPFVDPVHGPHIFNAYGLGLMLFDYHGRRLAQHAGMAGHSMAMVGFVPEDRVSMHAQNDHAKRLEMATFPNMRVSKRSPLYSAYHENREIADSENLSSWVTRKGESLPDLDVLTDAAGFTDRAYAIISVPRTGQHAA